MNMISRPGPKTRQIIHPTIDPKQMNSSTTEERIVNMNASQLKRIAIERRLDVLDMVYHNKAGHIGGSMSGMDILVTLYYGLLDTPKILTRAPERDRFVLSKGHCAESLYAVLADCGFFSKDELKTFTKFKTRLAEHPTKNVPGIEIATGALGHGLSAAIGMAIALKADKLPSHVYVLMGDGEQAEGSIWEAAMAGSKYKLDNLTAIVDRNRLQISGCTEDIMPIGDLLEKYRAFGWNTLTCDGHDPEQLLLALQAKSDGKPTVVIAETIKGKGSKVMENIAGWHHQIPTDEEYAQIRQDLERALKEAE